MDLAKLLSAATLRISSVPVAGQTIYVKEPTGPQLAAFTQARAEGETASATALLFFDCVVNSDGSSALTAEQARELAMGSTRISGKLIAAITGTLAEDAKNG